MTLDDWMKKWGISEEAITDLADSISYGITSDIPKNIITESDVMNCVRMEASLNNAVLMRNNVGALMDARGRPVRFGLMNDSKKLNQTVKSHDLIGFRKKLIDVNDVGKTLPIFLTRECKKPGWKYKGVGREKAQLAFALWLLAAGADSGFCTGPGSI